MPGDQVPKVKTVEQRKLDLATAIFSIETQVTALETSIVGRDELLQKIGDFKKQLAEFLKSS